jgi:hypothetical protein
MHYRPNSEVPELPAVTDWPESAFQEMPAVLPDLLSIYLEDFYIFIQIFLSSISLLGKSSFKVHLIGFTV